MRSVRPAASSGGNVEMKEQQRWQDGTMWRAEITLKVAEWNVVALWLKRSWTGQGGRNKRENWNKVKSSLQLLHSHINIYAHKSKYKKWLRSQKPLLCRKRGCPTSTIATHYIMMHQWLYTRVLLFIDPGSLFMMLVCSLPNGLSRSIYHTSISNANLAATQTQTQNTADPA